MDRRKLWGLVFGGEHSPWIPPRAGPEPPARTPQDRCQETSGFPTRISIHGIHAREAEQRLSKLNFGLDLIDVELRRM